MSVSTATYASWLEAAAEGEQSLSERYLGENIAMLNADQVPEVANKLYWDYLQAQGESGDEGGAEPSPEVLRDRFGEWVFDRAGMRQVEITHEGAAFLVDCFCGAWPFASEKTAALLERLCESPAEG